MICGIVAQLNIEKSVGAAGAIITTLAKAKEVRPVLEKLVTLSKDVASGHADGSARVAVLRRLFAALRSRSAVEQLVSVAAVRYASRSGGYIRILRLPTRRIGDSGQQAMLQWCE